MNYQLIMNSTCCMTDLPKEQQWIGVTVFYPDPEDGTSREVNAYWHEAPEGARKVTLENLDPLSIQEAIKAPGLNVKIVNGKVVDNSK